jgi:hypothetical protein
VFPCLFQGLAFDRPLAGSRNSHAHDLDHPATGSTRSMIAVTNPSRTREVTMAAVNPVGREDCISGAVPS